MDINEKNGLLREHQLTLVEMLREIDRICRKHDIKYALFAGTALGAVRHGGVIPWDDDLDIVMLREEYDKFLSVAPAEMDQEKYYLQKEFSEHWPCFFSKFRKNNTAYMEKMVPKDRAQHQGVYIDIFPCDNLSNSSVMRKLQFISSKIVIAKSLSRRGYLTDSPKKKLFICFCKLLPLAPFVSAVKCANAGKSDMVHTFFGASSRYEKSIYPRAWFEELCMMPFEGGEYPISAHYDSLLSTLYGDYMTPPSEEDRKCKVHAMKIDLDRSYEEYLDWQAEQKIDVYTRSIR